MPRGDAAWRAGVALVVVGNGPLVAVLWLLVLWPWAKILAKAGYPRWLCVLAFVPIVNFIALWMFAVADWPALKRASQPRLVAARSAAL